MPIHKLSNYMKCLSKTSNSLVCIILQPEKFLITYNFIILIFPTPIQYPNCYQNYGYKMHICSFPPLSYTSKSWLLRSWHHDFYFSSRLQSNMRHALWSYDTFTFPPDLENILKNSELNINFHADVPLFTPGQTIQHIFVGKLCSNDNLCLESCTDVKGEEVSTREIEKREESSSMKSVDLPSHVSFLYLSEKSLSTH